MSPALPRAAPTPVRDDDIDLQPDELGCDLAKRSGASLGPAILDRDGATFDPAELAQSLDKGRHAMAFRGGIGPINLGVKQTGERRAGNPHAAFEVAETGNVAWSRCCDTRRRKGEQQGTQTLTYTGAPVSDPTVRTCRSDVKGEVSSGQNREDESTDAEHRGEVARIRDEGSVMGLDRRGCVVQPRPRAN